MTRARRIQLVIGGAVVWTVGAAWIVPALIRAAYAGAPIPLLRGLMRGRGQTALDAYLALWRSLALRLSLGAAGLAVLVALVVWFRRSRLPQLRQTERARPHTYSAGDLLCIGAWSAIVLGLVEAAHGFIAHRIDHLPRGEVVSGELFWMTAIMATCGVTLLVLLVLGAHRAVGGRFDRAAVAVTIAFGVPVSSILLALRAGIAWYALTVLALGVGVAMARLLAPFPRTVSSAVRRQLRVLVAALVVWGCVLPVWRRWQEGRVVSRLPQPAAGAPNVLVVIWDAVRAFDLSTYGHTRQTTPVLDSLARRALVFERAIATAPWSLPSHSSLFTGRYPNELTAGRRIPLDRTHPTIGEEMQKRGYVTGGFTANLFYGSDDYGIARGFTWYDARPPMRWRAIVHTWHLARLAEFWIALAVGNHENLLRRPAQHVNDAFLAWQARHTGRPFLAILNNFDAHEPYYPYPPFNTVFGAPAPRYWFDENENHYPADTLQELRRAYNGGIRYMDAELGRMLQTLRGRGLLDNTLVIVTGDHGEEFGEHGDDVFSHARSLYYPVLRVPMVVAFPPRVAQERRLTTPVSIRDIPATILDAAHAPPAFPGISLLGFASGLDTAAAYHTPLLAITERHNLAKPRDRWPAAKTDRFSVLDDTLHVIWSSTTHQVFDIARDPWENVDLAGTPAGRAAEERLRTWMDSAVAGPNGKWRARARPAR